MLWYRRRGSRLFPAAGLASAGALLVLTPLSAPAQQSTPTGTITAPAAALRGVPTAVSATFSVPTGLSMPRHPRLRVTDSRGKLVELLPLMLTQRPPAGRGTSVISRNYDQVVSRNYGHRVNGC
jgi:hypothetical protein